MPRQPRARRQRRGQEQTPEQPRYGTWNQGNAPTPLADLRELLGTSLLGDVGGGVGERRTGPEGRRDASAEAAPDASAPHSGIEGRIRGLDVRLDTLRLRINALERGRLDRVLRTGANRLAGNPLPNGTVVTAGTPFVAGTALSSGAALPNVILNPVPSGTNSAGTTIEWNTAYDTEPTYRVVNNLWQQIIPTPRVF